MPPIDVPGLPRLPIAFMNSDHDDSVELANALDALLEDGNDLPAIDEAFEDFVDHNREHFLREEEDMQRLGFPAYPVHKAEHARFLAEVNGLMQRWKESRDPAEARTWLREAFGPWLVHHVATMDTVTAHFLANAGH